MENHHHRHAGMLSTAMLCFRLECASVIAIVIVIRAWNRLIE